MIVAVYGDDFFIFGKEKNLQKHFYMKDLGVVSECLEMNITRDVEGEKLWVDQRDYAEKILKKFNTMENKPVSTPVELGLDFYDCNNDSESIDVPY